MRKILASLLIIASALSANAAPVSFNISATAAGSGFGYVAAQSYNFVLTTGESFSANAQDAFYAFQNSWTEELVTEDQLWTSVGGSVQGNLVRPTLTQGDPWSWLKTLENTVGPDYLYLRVDADTSSSLGVSTLGGQAIAGIDISINPTDFIHSGSWTDPVVYFSNYLGSYALSGGLLKVETETGTIVSFTPTNLTIATAVPEPGSCAMLAGAAALLCVATSRCRRSAK